MQRKYTYIAHQKNPDQLHDVLVVSESCVDRHCLLVSEFFNFFLPLHSHLVKGYKSSGHPAIARSTEALVKSGTTNKAESLCEKLRV